MPGGARWDSIPGMSGELGKVLEWDGQTPLGRKVKGALGKLVEALERAERPAVPVPEKKAKKVPT